MGNWICQPASLCFGAVAEQFARSMHWCSWLPTAAVSSAHLSPSLFWRIFQCCCQKLWPGGGKCTSFLCVVFWQRIRNTEIRIKPGMKSPECVHTENIRVWMVKLRVIYRFILLSEAAINIGIWSQMTNVLEQAKYSSDRIGCSLLLKTCQTQLPDRPPVATEFNAAGHVSAVGSS